ncbi:MAG: competence protein ComEA [Thermoleophilaceae bacterium]|jgi:competence protein ComEA|nr:competence protein ComEA [Thermoleophilaceae bacterium]
MPIDGDKLRIGGYVVVAILVALLGIRLMNGGDQGGVKRLTLDPPGDARPTASTGAPMPAVAPRPRTLMIQVAGEVRTPGVYSLPAGARGQQAVERAGGLTGRADQAGVNLVAPLRDGQQVIVPRRGAAGATGTGGAASGAAGATGAAATPVSLSSATVEQLDTLDGIGPTLAQRIVQYRQAHGGFRSIDELRQVTGIGEKRMAALRKAVAP